MAMHGTNLRCVCATGRDALFFCLLLAVFLLHGCSAAPPSAESTQPTGAQPTGAQPTGAQPSDQTPAADQLLAGYEPVDDPLESWKVTQVSGTKIGYSHVIEQKMVNGQDEMAVLIKIEDETKVKRFNELTVQKYSSQCLIHENGEMIAFHSQLEAGPSIVRTEGKVIGDRLRLKSDSGSEIQIDSNPWEASTGGVGADEYLLRAKPLKPGESRTIKMLAPVVHQPMTVSWKALDFEQVVLPDGQTAKLLLVEEKVDLPGVTLEGMRWVDEQGVMWMSRLPSLNQTTYRTTKDNALTDDGGAFDLGLASIVKLELPEKLKQIHEVPRLVYRATLPNADPAKSFQAGASQAVRRIDEHTVELEVIAIRPDQPGEVDHRGDEAPTEDDRRPNSLIQSDDQRVLDLAKEVDAKSPWETALQLELLVHKRIRAKNFSQAFASAADVAEHLQGDCTEHAVLLAALCRAKGIPARVAMGLVYYPREDGFAYHMWNEAWIGGRWTPLDATLGRGGIGAGHLRVSTSNLKGASPYAAFLPVLPLIQQLKLELTEDAN